MQWRKQAWALFSEKGFWKLHQREGRKLHENIKSIVTKSLKDDKYPKIMPGSKDYVSVDKKQHMQKWLLLVNLKELYSSFLKDYET